MPKFRVRQYTVVEDFVIADDEDSAIEIANDNARWNHLDYDYIVEECEGDTDVPKDPKYLIVEETIECYKCGEKQESTQRFCVNCATCLT